jgi:predicted phosphodiesterase
LDAAMKIGVVADTHHPEFLDALPAGLFDALEGVDLILHAGDVGGRETLERLAEIAPVEAVRGDHDGDLAELPKRRVIEAGGRRIGIIHGNRNRLLEEPVTFVGTVSLGYLWPTPGLDGWLRRRFPNAEVIVYGHTHAPRLRRRNGVLLFNPGAVYQVTAVTARQRLARHPNWFEWSWLQVVRHRRRHPPPSVGILALDEKGVRASIVPL